MKWKDPKAKYYVQRKPGKLPPTAEEWLQGTVEVAGSWWPFWIEWLQKRSGAKKKAPASVGDKAHPALDPAPGTYVMEAC